MDGKENKLFEESLVQVDSNAPDRREKVAAMLPRKTDVDVVSDYNNLQNDVGYIEAGLMAFPHYRGLSPSSGFTRLGWLPQARAARTSSGRRASVCRSSADGEQHHGGHHGACGGGRQVCSGNGDRGERGKEEDRCMPCWPHKTGLTKQENEVITFFQPNKK